MPVGGAAGHWQRRPLGGLLEPGEAAGVTTAVQALAVDGLRKLFPVGGGLFRRATSFIHAVDDVSFQVAEGESLGLVGESGCGKTTAAKMLVKLIEPTSGRIVARDRTGEMVDLASLGARETKLFRRSAQMIYQDPYESLNPRRTVFDTIAEPLVVQGIGTLRDREARVSAMMAQVGLTPVANYMFRFPHEMSGGQRQRVAIARALVLEPRLVVADEPTSMLDVSVRANIMQLMLDLKARLNATYVYITHDVAVARYMCDRIAVMYLGKVVEIGPAEDVLGSPVHPYTRALISAVPVPDPSYSRPRVEIMGGIARPVDPPKRCRFFDRCPLASKVCEDNDHPPLTARGSGRSVACYNA
jgi:peptide/nickel transport system ATP-binding protein